MATTLKENADLAIETIALGARMSRERMLDFCETLYLRVMELEDKNKSMRSDLDRLTTQELPEGVHEAMCFFESHGVFLESQVGPMKEAGEYGLILGRHAEKSNIRLAEAEEAIDGCQQCVAAYEYRQKHPKGVTMPQPETTNSESDGQQKRGAMVRISQGDIRELFDLPADAEVAFSSDTEAGQMMIRVQLCDLDDNRFDVVPDGMPYPFVALSKFLP